MRRLKCVVRLDGQSGEYRILVGLDKKLKTVADVVKTLSMDCPMLERVRHLRCGLITSLRILAYSLMDSKSVCPPAFAFSKIWNRSKYMHSKEERRRRSRRGRIKRRRIE